MPALLCIKQLIRASALQNCIYRGDVRHKERSYPGQHQAIIEADLWEQVQAKIASNRVDRKTGVRARQPSDAQTGHHAKGAKRFFGVDRPKAVTTTVSMSRWLEGHGAESRTLREELGNVVKMKN